MTPYAGPLFYPPIGMIAVTEGGSRIEVWPNESDNADCFTGLLLADGRAHTQRVVLDLSCLWMRAAIVHLEEPSEADLALGWLPRDH